jgi:predicted acylesterase/phospholipase RssA
MGRSQRRASGARGDQLRAHRRDKNLKPDQRYKLVVMATDVTRGRLLRLPWDYRLLNLKPYEQLVADAVRASSSIPLLFEPVTVRDGKSAERATLVDGGVLSNFAIEIFDRAEHTTPRWPTFGVKIIPRRPPERRSRCGASRRRRCRSSSCCPPLTCSSRSSPRRSSATTRPPRATMRPPQNDPGRHQPRRDRRVRRLQGQARDGRRERHHSRRAIPRELGLGELQEGVPRRHRRIMAFTRGVVGRREAPPAYPTNLATAELPLFRVRGGESARRR